MKLERSSLSQRNSIQNEDDTPITSISAEGWQVATSHWVYCHDVWWMVRGIDSLFPWCMLTDCTFFHFPPQPQLSYYFHYFLVIHGSPAFPQDRLLNKQTHPHPPKHFEKCFWANDTIRWCFEVFVTVTLTSRKLVTLPYSTLLYSKLLYKSVNCLFIWKSGANQVVLPATLRTKFALSIIILR